MTIDWASLGQERFDRTVFRRASLVDGTQPDPRIADAIAIIRAARQPDGTWLQGDRDPGAVWFDVDVPAGQPSKWLTLFATRVLNWWDSEAPAVD